MTEHRRGQDGAGADGAGGVDLDGADVDGTAFDLDAPTPSRPDRPRARVGDGGGGGGGNDDGGLGADGPRRGIRLHRVLQRSWPEAAPAWLRGPAAVVAVALVAAVVGGVFATHQQRASLESDLAVERVLGGFDVGEPSVLPAQVDASGNPLLGVGGVVDLRLGIPLTNTSGAFAAVSVTGVEIAEGSRGSDARIAVRAAADPQQLGPLASATVELDASVDCDDVPDGESSLPAAAPDWVVASVLLEGEEHAVRWGTQNDWTSLAQQLTTICHTSRGPTVDLSSVTLLEDGRLQLDLENPGSVPAEVEVLTTGTDVVGEPALPVVVEPGVPVSVVLSAAPDCARAVDLVDQTAQVFVVPVGSSEGDATQYDPEGTAQITVWLGRQTALACT